MLTPESLPHVGVAVSEADCREAALQLFDDDNFDLMLLAVMMPGIDGYTLCQSIRRHARVKELPIVMLTGCHYGESLKRA